MRIQGPHSLGRRLNAIALCIAITITAALAANHLFAAYDYETRRIQADSDTISEELSRLIYQMPDVWHFQDERILGVIEHSHGHGHSHPAPRQIVVRNKFGQEALTSGSEIQHPYIRRTSSIQENGTIAGEVEITESVIHIWTHAIVPLLLGLLLGAAVFLVLKFLPMRALLRREQELRETNLQLQQAQKMEAIGQLTGGIAHDFNNLLCVVIGNLELIQESMSQNDSKFRFAESAINAAQRGATLTQQLLSFARKQMLRPEVTTLNLLVAQATTLLQRTLGETIEIETKLADDLWPAEIDPVQLETAILNLATNARCAMPDGGRLTMETANIVLDDAYAAQHEDVASGHYACLTISDTGVGIPANILPKVFEPFFTTKDIGEGSGLGLSMVHGFIRQSRGHIAISSQEGHGTVVKLFFPAYVDRGTIAATPDNLPLAMEGNPDETILVVEDDPDLLKSTVANVSSLGYSVLQATDGQSALTILDTDTKVHLLFTDVVLPNKMDGASLADEARKRRPDIKIVYTSGYNENIVGANGVLDDNVELLSKPYRRESLAQQLRTALDC